MKRLNIKRRYLLLLGVIFLIIPLYLFQTASALFTDKVDDPNNTFTTGTLDIDVSPSTVFNITNMIPGDYVTKTVTVKNVGNLGSTYVVGNTNVGNTALWTNKVDGLQVEIKKGTTVYYTGPISGLNTNPSPTLALPVSQVDVLTVKVSLPTTADNTFQKLTEKITFTFQATQLPGGDRS